jgi:hypothetical protein
MFLLVNTRSTIESIEVVVRLLNESSCCQRASQRSLKWKLLVFVT